MMPMEAINSLLSNLLRSVDILVLFADKAVYNISNCKHLAEHLKCLRSLFEDFGASNPSTSEPAFKALETLDSLLSKARELVERCGPRSSKIYMVLRSRHFDARFENISIKLCNALSALLTSSLHVSEQARMQIEQCVEELKAATYKNDGFSEQAAKELETILVEYKEASKVDNEKLKEIAEVLGLTLNQELLREASFLEKEKEYARADKDKHEEDYINLVIGLVTQLCDYMVELKQSWTEAGVAIPADFRCPLSLELMSDPVIVASGQTYERSYIQQWLDEGMTTCPKTRQTLNHKNLIPNFTVKALIANWCETNRVPLPEPAKPVAYVSYRVPPKEPDSHHANRASPSTASSSLHASESIKKDTSLAENARHLLGSNTHAESSSLRSAFSNGEHQHQVKFTQKSGSSHVSNQKMGHSRDISLSSNASSVEDGQTSAGGEMHASEGHAGLSDCSPYSTDVSGELNAPSAATPPQPMLAGPSTRLTDALYFPPRLPNVWSRRPEMRNSTPLVISSNVSSANSTDAGIHRKVEKLVGDLQSDSVEIQRAAAGELRLLAKFNMENRIVIVNCGATKHLVSLLSSPDLATQEIAVTALLNLSINDNNKNEIAAAGAIEPLINVLQVGNPEAKENAAATLFSLSVMEENKIAIGQSGAIPPLVDLLKNGTPRGKKDAATALFNLSILHENKARIVHAGAVKHLINLMDPAGGMIDKAVAVLSNLATIREGRAAIGEARGIPVLVEVVEIGSQRGKENAAAALLHLCTNCNKFRAQVLQEGAIPPLVALSQTGTPRAKEKAQALLRHFREQRHATMGRTGDRHMDRQFG
eukprot:TRINITY_DN8165_c0_g1_i1.p1 TRINITY_DN8165_c0_g1~~TRINITY_DN8165_c0_g1_i1.p1  ORF type:complete len:824 (+),score=162.42 TRINITY_DN8165_c0_g1_i1:665-3136(+)